MHWAIWVLVFVFGVHRELQELRGVASGLLQRSSRYTCSGVSVAYFEGRLVFRGRNTPRGLLLGRKILSHRERPVTEVSELSFGENLVDEASCEEVAL